jgi:hypothetical protein
LHQTQGSYGYEGLGAPCLAKNGTCLANSAMRDKLLGGALGYCSAQYRQAALAVVGGRVRFDSELLVVEAAGERLVGADDGYVGVRLDLGFHA